mgnify:CR=1 FL=1
MWAVDTNVLVRYYTADDPLQHAVAVSWLKAHAPCRVPITVVLELHWVLASAYAMSAARTAAVFRHLLDSPAFKIESPHAVERALEATVGGLEFPDAVHWALAHDCEGIATFDDRGFARKAGRMKLHPPVVMPVAGSGG